MWIILLAAGCSFNLPLSKNDFGPSLPQNAGAKEVVERVNANIERLHSWRADGVRISGPDMPMHLSGHLAVERPRNFRLTAGVGGFTEEADFGSNAEWFWFWVKRGQPNYVFRARHEDIPYSEVLRQIPFEPDWVMEAFGVVPIDPEQIILQPGDHHTVNLISERLSPSGQPVKKVVIVDASRGVIVGHNLYDRSGNLIAKATLDKHELDRTSRVVLPRLIVLEWPQAKLQIRLDIGHVEVNPGSIPARVWDVPNKQPYYRTVDLGVSSRGRRQRPAPVAPPQRGGDERSVLPADRKFDPDAGATRINDGAIGKQFDHSRSEPAEPSAWSTPIEPSETRRGSEPAVEADGSFDAGPGRSVPRRERPNASDRQAADPFAPDF